MNAAQARAIIQAFANGNRNVVRAETMLGTLSGASGSVLFQCEDGGRYVAKGTRNNKGLVAEHVVARLGQLLEAPVGDVQLLEVPVELTSHPAVAAMGAGLAHATRFIENISDRTGLTYSDVQENRERFARLCVLYSLARAQDHQLFYSTGNPRVVYSLDHGHFLPGGPGWTAATLLANTAPTIDGWFAPANLTNAELSDARARLGAITDADIAAVLNGPPPEWPFTPEERAALDQFLRNRRDGLLALLPQA
jgi:hypothetical protein